MKPLALKYRPKRFADIVGQKPTRAVLAKMVESGDLPPSLIFAGVRGTGKTSAARILAKAINCSATGSFEPCGECVNCVAVETESAPFVVELDAASHGGADSMRQLVEDAMYSAGQDWKVYVLDEVHSVSRTGFDVLLKTLEEPPPRTSFVLVTTEPERIPDTIQARSMYFRFAKITEHDLLARLEEVAGLEEIPLEPDGAQWIVEHANGGMRDALMTLDQVHRLGDDVPVTEVLLTGLFGEQSVGVWVEALLSGNPAKAAVVADELVAQHGSVAAMIDRALVTLRNALLAKAGYRTYPSDMPTGLSQADLVEMVRKLWSMRQQVRSLGPDDRAAVVALSAEMTRGVAGDVVVDNALTVEQLEEAIRG